MWCTLSFHSDLSSLAKWEFCDEVLPAILQAHSKWNPEDTSRHEWVPIYSKLYCVSCFPSTLESTPSGHKAMRSFSKRVTCTYWSEGCRHLPKCRSQEESQKTHCKVCFPMNGTLYAAVSLFFTCSFSTIAKHAHIRPVSTLERTLGIMSRIMCEPCVCCTVLSMAFTSSTRASKSCRLCRCFSAVSEHCPYKSISSRIRKTWQINHGIVHKRLLRASYIVSNLGAV